MGLRALEELACIELKFEQFQNEACRNYLHLMILKFKKKCLFYFVLIFPKEKFCKKKIMKLRNLIGRFP